MNAFVSTEANERYPRQLGTLYKNESTKKTGWSWYDVSNSSFHEYVAHIVFPEMEIAANFLYALMDKSNKYCLEQPVAEDIKRYLERKAIDLRKEEQEILGRFWGIRAERSQLFQFAKQNRISGLRYLTEDTDDEKLVRDLLQFEIHIEDKDDGEFKTVPFVSETSLYNLIGKEDARTAMVLIRNLCDRIAPHIAVDPFSNRDDLDEDTE